MRSLAVAVTIVCGVFGFDALALGVAGPSVVGCGDVNADADNVALVVFTSDTPSKVRYATTAQQRVVNSAAHNIFARDAFIEIQHSDLMRAVRNGFAKGLVLATCAEVVRPFRGVGAQPPNFGYGGVRSADVIDFELGCARPGAVRVIPKANPTGRKDAKSGSLAFYEGVATGFRLIGAPLVVVRRTPSPDSGGDGCNEGPYAHSKLPVNQRSFFVRVSGLIDSRLSCNTVTGNPWLAVGVALLLCAAGALGVWRLSSERYVSGLLLLAVLVFGSPALFMLR